MRRLVDVLYRAFPIRNCYIELNEIDEKTNRPLVLKNGFRLKMFFPMVEFDHLAILLCLILLTPNVRYKIMQYKR